MMTVAVLKDKKSIALEKRPIPDPGAGEVLVKVAYCGICGSDVHAYNDLIFPVGTVLGHEFSGIIEKTGEGVSLNEGDKVVVRPPGICGHCQYCVRGELALCVEHFSNTIGLKLQGGFAEYVLVQEFQAMLLPEKISLKSAAQLEPVAVCIHGLNRSYVTLGGNVVIIGAGSIGLITMLGVFKKGARTVCVLELNPMRRKLAEKWGADYCIDPTDVTLLNQVISEMGSVDVVFDCAGAADTFNLGNNLVRKGGQLLIIGATTDTISYRQIDVLQRSIDINHSMGYFVEDFEVAVKCQEVGMFPVDDLVSEIYPLSKIEDAFNKIRSSKEVVKILIQPHP